MGCDNVTIFIYLEDQGVCKSQVGFLDQSVTIFILSDQL
jgi:hypothetical protein